MQDTPQQKPERNYGIDLLRIYAMFLIIVTHIFNFGEVWNNSEGICRVLISSLDVFTTCAVDCYALVSGYVGYSKIIKYPKIGKYLSLWVQVFFYSIIIAIIAPCIFPSAVQAEIPLVKYFLPVLTTRYWYFSAYTIVFFAMPLLNLLINNLNRKALLTVAIGLFVIFSLPSVVTYSLNFDPFNLNSGYSALWLMALYVTGALIKVLDIDKKCSTCLAIIIIFFCYVFTCVFKYFVPSFNGLIAGGEVLVFIFSRRDYNGRNFYLDFKRCILIFGSMMIMLAFINVFGSVFGMDSLSDIYSASDVRIDGGSGYNANLIPIGGTLGLIINSPFHAIYFLGSPFPWQWRSLSDIIAFFISAIFYLYVFWQALKFIRTKDRHSALLSALFIIAIIGMIVFGWGVSNAGTALRHRDKLIFVYLLMLAIINEQKLQNQFQSY